MTRENTFRVDYSCFPVKPSYEKVHGFCRTVLGVKREDLRRLQCNRGEQCAFVEVSNLTLAQKIVDEHDGKHEVEYGGKKIKLRITIEDGSVEVKVHDLPESVTKEKIVEFLCGFGEVLSIHELTWGEEYEYAGVPTGVWSARMLIKRNIDSWVTIDGQPALIIYKGQLLSCRYCKEQTHSGISCVQNKKLLVQKSYANVAKAAQRPPKKPTGVKPSAKPGDRGLSASTPVLSAAAFPELPKPASQSEQSVSTTKPNGQSEQIGLPVPSSERPKHDQGSSPSPHAAESTKTPAVLLDLFKKPATRSQSKFNKNGNDTDDSTTSNSSRRNRDRPPGKKPRCDNSDDEKEEE